MTLIDRLGGRAARLDRLRRPLLALAAAMVAVIAWIALATDGPEGERYLMPAIAVLLWTLCAHAFIVNFRRVPPPPATGAPLRRRIMQSVKRTWYRLLALLLLATTAAALLLTWKLLSVWLREYWTSS